MKSIAALAMRGRFQAGALTSVFGLLSFWLPPLSCVSGATVSLATLRQGPAEGLRVLLLAALMTAAVTVISTGGVTRMAGLVLAVWVPAWFCSIGLRQAADQGRMVLMATILASAYALVMRGVTGDVAAWWQARLEGVLAAAAGAGATTARFDAETIQAFAAVMNSAVAGGLVVSLVITVLLGRWWQSLLYNPGGFRKEFHGLRLPRSVAYTTLLLVLVVAWQGREGSPPYGPAMDLLVVALLGFMFVGLAVCHERVTSAGRSVGWLVALYIALVLQPHFVILGLAATGVADTFLDFRRRSGKSAAG